MYIYIYIRYIICVNEEVCISTRQETLGNLFGMSVGKVSLENTPLKCGRMQEFEDMMLSI